MKKKTLKYVMSMMMVLILIGCKQKTGSEMHLGAQIVYTSSDGGIALVRARQFGGAVILSNKVVESTGNIEFDREVTTIGEGAFYHCSDISSITIPASITSIEAGSFTGCDSLKIIVVDSDNQIYDSRDSCNAVIMSATNTLTHGCQGTVIPLNVTGIGNKAFNQCIYLSFIEIPLGVTIIGEGAFCGCERLTEITIPSSVTDIGKEAFFCCSSMQRAFLSEGVMCIGDWAFSSCESLTDITLPSSIVSIGNMAFNGCNSLTDFTILSPVPPKIEDLGLDTTVVVHVLPGCGDVYSISDGWKEYTIVEDIP